METISKFFYSTLVLIQILLVAAKAFDFVSWGWSSWQVWAPLILFAVLRIGYVVAYAFEGLFIFIFNLAIFSGVIYLFYYLFIK